MGDLLKAKIQQRPDKQQLVRQHILEDVGDVDRSLAERQRMLVKCRLADSLNTQLAHRPGPLELIKKNILHTDEPIERAVKGMCMHLSQIYVNIPEKFIVVHFISAKKRLNLITSNLVNYYLQ